MVQRWSTPTTQPVSLIRSQLACESRRRYLPSLRIEEGACAKWWVFTTMWILICFDFLCSAPEPSNSLQTVFNWSRLTELKQNPQINKLYWGLPWAARGCRQLILFIIPVLFETMMVCQNSIVSSAQGNDPALLNQDELTLLTWVIKQLLK